MLQVFQGLHLAEAHLVCSLLQAEGIPAEVRGMDLATTVGMGSAVPGILPTVWIVDASDSGRASELIARFTKGEVTASFGPSWNCPKCEEAHEPQFQSCWKCGTPKPAPASD